MNLPRMERPASATPAGQQTNATQYTLPRRSSAVKHGRPRRRRSPGGGAHFSRLAWTGLPGDPQLRPHCCQCRRFLSNSTVGGQGRAGDACRNLAWCERCLRRADEAALRAWEGRQ